MFSFSHFSVSKWKFQSLPRKEVLLFESQKPWSEQWNQSVSHLPLQGGSWQARTDSGFSPSQWSPALQRTCLTSVPSPQVTEHYRNKGCDYRCLFHQDFLPFPMCTLIHTHAHTSTHAYTALEFFLYGPVLQWLGRQTILALYPGSIVLSLKASQNCCRTKWRQRRQCI